MKKSEKIIRELAEQAGIEVNGSKPWDIQIQNENFYNRVLSHGSLGLGESYMEGWWDCEQLDELIYKFLVAGAREKFEFTFPMVLQYIKCKLLNPQTVKKSRRVALHHYDIDIEMWESMLGKSMAYSCGYWKNANTLDESQEAKYELLFQKLNINGGSRLLDMGSGWGGLAKYLAEVHGCDVVCVNISSEQINYSRKSCTGLPIKFYMCDYRDTHIYNPKNEPFDAVISLGLGEHVGPKNHRSWFKLVSKMLNNGGIFFSHACGSNVSREVGDPWIDKYIFPGSKLPSVSQWSSASEGLFVMEDWHNLGINYVKTLESWYMNFVNYWNQPNTKLRHVLAKEDHKFFLMMEYYLQSCKALFRSRKVQLWQAVFSKGERYKGYQPIR